MNTHGFLWLKWPKAGWLFCYQGYQWRINNCDRDDFKCEVVKKCNPKARRRNVGEIKIFRSWEMAPIANRQWHEAVVLYDSRVNQRAR